MKETSVNVVIPHTSRNVVGIETIAISSGTNASIEANTNASTHSAPMPPSRASANTPGAPLSELDACCRASIPDTCTGAPRTVCPAAAERAAARASGFSLKPAPRLGGTNTSANVVRPSAETKRRSPVLPSEATRVGWMTRPSRSSSAPRTAPLPPASWRSLRGVR